MKTLNEKLFEHWDLADAAIPRAVSGKAQYAYAAGRGVPATITVMIGGEETHWVVMQDLYVVPCFSTYGTIGCFNLHVVDRSGANDTPTVEVRK
jgi:hypothetical protein